MILAGDASDPYCAEIDRLLARHTLRAQVELIGHIGGQAKWDLLRNARFLVLPSYSENFGNVVVEALAVGCPAIVTPEVGAKDVVLRSGGGLVANGDPDSLRTALVRLWDDADERTRMGEAGARYVRAHLGWPAVAEQAADCYRTVLREAAAG
jgi:glycosyltransferase involved in cell wall biosynthesis